MSGKYSIVLLAAALLATANGRSTTISFLPADIHQIEGVHYFAGIPWMLIPGDKGVAHLAIFTDTSPPVTRDIADDVIFNLYTNSRGATTPHRLRVNDTENLSESGFDPTNPTKILIHGFGGDGQSANIVDSRDAYLAKGNYNVIGVDWSVLCPTPNYIAACRNAVLTGELVAQLVEFLVAEAGARLQDIHIIGHSLGGQVAGFAGNSTTTGKVGRITGLDSAYPLFGNAEPAATRVVCYAEWPDGPSIESYQEYIYNIVFMILTYFLPICSMSFTYARVGLELWGSQSIGECTQRQLENIKSKRRVVKMMIVVVSIFAVCWLPFHMYFILMALVPQITNTKYIQEVYLAIYWLAMSSSMYNPIIYCWMNSRFRRGFKQVFSCCPCVHMAPETLSRREVVTSRYSCSGSPEAQCRIIRNDSYFEMTLSPSMELTYPQLYAKLRARGRKSFS